MKKHFIDLTKNPFSSENHNEITSVLLDKYNVFNTVFEKVDLNGIKIFYFIVAKALNMPDNSGGVDWIWIKYHDLKILGFSEHVLKYGFINKILLKMANTYQVKNNKEEFIKYGIIQNTFIHKVRSLQFGVKIHKDLVDDFLNYKKENGFTLDFKFFPFIKTKSELKLLEIITAFMLGIEKNTLYLTIDHIKQIVYLDQDRTLSPSRVISYYFLPYIESLNKYCDFIIASELQKDHNGYVRGVKLNIERK